MKTKTQRELFDKIMGFYYTNQLTKTEIRQVLKQILYNELLDKNISKR